jgi:diguanylate cyclase (GGDEF)-like protein
MHICSKNNRGFCSAKPPPSARWAAVCLLTLAAVFGGAARAGEADDLARLDAVYALGEKDSNAALKELADWQAQWVRKPSPAVQREYLKTLITLQVESGQMQASAPAIAELARLAKEQHDVPAMVDASVFEAANLTEAGKPGAAIGKLNEVAAQAAQSNDADTQRKFHTAYGAAELALGKFELALQHYLQALQFADLRKTHAKDARMRQLSKLSNLYLTMKNPEKGLSVIKESLALAEQLGAKKMQATLYLNQGYALVELGRAEEAVKANEQALRISREAGLVRTEATVLSNIADRYLVTREFPKAAAMARLAMAKAREAGSQGTFAAAQANLGFALIGQKQISEGIAEVKGSLKSSKDAGAIADVEATLAELSRMLEETGMYREALSALREQQVLSQELFRSDRARAVAALQEEFDTTQRKKQIELLARENSLKDAELSNRRLQQVVTLLGAVATIMAAVFVFLLYRRVRKTNQKLREANKQLEFHSVRDPLTGLYNRRSFLDLMKQRQHESAGGRRADTSPDNPDGLMIMDIDHFKHINDTWGHATGDVVLVEVAKRLKKTVRDTDMVMRWGGEEFLVFSPKANAAQLKGLADRLLHAIGDAPVDCGGQAVPVTVTAGFLTLPFAGLPENQCNWEKAMQIADMALYMGKLHGRNRAYGLSRLLAPVEQAMPVLERDLAAALSAGLVELIEVLGPVRAQ